MSASFVFNMGYDTSHVTSVLAREGIQDGSKVVLVVPNREDERQENSISDIEKYVESLDFEVSLEVFPAGKSLQEDTEELAGLFRRLEEVVLSLSGGSRDLLIPLTLARICAPENVEKTYFRSDLDSELEEIRLPGVQFELRESEEELVRVLKDGPHEPKRIVSLTDLSQSTVYSILNGLEERGLVERTEDGRSLTSFARILI